MALDMIETDAESSAIQIAGLHDDPRRQPYPAKVGLAD